jgi:hypothetical protein
MKTTRARNCNTQCIGLWKNPHACCSARHRGHEKKLACAMKYNVQHIRQVEDECVHKSYDTQHEKKKHNTYCKAESKNQVSYFLHHCLKMLSDPKDEKKLTHLLTGCMGEEETTVAMYALRYVRQVTRQKRMGR